MQQAQKLLEGVTRYVLKSLASDPHPSDKVKMIVEGITLFVPFDRPPQSWEDYQQILLRPDVQDILSQVDPTNVSPPVVGRLLQLATRYAYWHEDTKLSRSAHSVKNYLLILNDAVQFFATKNNRKSSSSPVKSRPGSASRSQSVDSAGQRFENGQGNGQSQQFDFPPESPTHSAATNLISGRNRRSLSSGADQQQPGSPTSNAHDSYVSASKSPLVPKPASERVADRDKTSGMVDHDESTSYTTTWLKHELSQSDVPFQPRRSSASSSGGLASSSSASPSPGLQRTSSSLGSSKKPILRHQSSNLSVRSDASGRNISFAPELEDFPGSPGSRRGSVGSLSSVSGRPSSATDAFRNNGTNNSQLQHQAFASSLRSDERENSSPSRRRSVSSNFDDTASVASGFSALSSSTIGSKGAMPAVSVAAFHEPMRLDNFLARANNVLLADDETRKMLRSLKTPQSQKHETEREPVMDAARHLDPRIKKNFSSSGDIVPDFREIIQGIDRIREERMNTSLKFATLLSAAQMKEETILSEFMDEDRTEGETVQYGEVIEEMRSMGNDAAKVQRAILESRDRGLRSPKSAHSPTSGLSRSNSFASKNSPLNRSNSSASGVRSESPRSTASPRSSIASPRSTAPPMNQRPALPQRSSSHVNVQPDPAAVARMAAEIEALRLKLQSEQQAKQSFQLRNR
eukprot:ANDGO_02393.mRNA.2 hypothetical protein